MRLAAFSLLSGTLALAAALATAASELTARGIVQAAIDGNGGDAWMRPKTLHLKGRAILFQDGRAESRTLADRYEMWRVFPSESASAHAANGKVRFDASAAGKLLFQLSYDGERSYNQDGPLPDDQAGWADNFGFGILRFALDGRFELTRMADDQVEGHPCHFVQVKDPAGTRTLFAFDSRDFAARKVAFDTARGWHERIYSEFAWNERPRFRQPRRVRLYYRGVLTNDIDWQSWEVDAEIPDATFVIPARKAP